MQGEPMSKRQNLIKTCEGVLQSCTERCTAVNTCLHVWWKDAVIQNCGTKPHVLVKHNSKSSQKSRGQS
ncbi:unnamed protein product [Pleuronectes platessa]|uniref:Uncharacterized protein n=1 Tax=Pleuronectes platessa TaxID=8262 RepID=A0A9N7YB91_PLEPL|nr:unnamed protein product [Pleuronectes platessa]